MNLSTLPGRKMSPEAAAAKAASFLARRKAMHGDATMTAPVTDPPANDPPANDPPAAPVEATDEHGVGLGFPKDTPTKDMTDAQRANYWHNQSKVQQARVPKNLAELQAAAEELRTLKASQGTPADQQIEQVRRETEERVRTEASKDSALALLRVSLHNRGKNADEIDGLLQYVALDPFLTSEKKVNTDAVVAYVNQIAPTGTGGGGGGLPGQGRHEQTPADPAAAGKAEAERRGYKPADRSKSSLMPTTS